MWYQDRCADCIYLYEGDNGEWICDHNGDECEKVPDEYCPVVMGSEDGGEEFD